MIVFRLSKKAYSVNLSGKGAEETGGRWNSKGIPMVYTSLSRALCTVEIAVHVPLGLVPSGYQLITLDIPERFGVEEPDLNSLTPGWKSFPYTRETQLLGDSFIKSKNSLVMKVPSAVVQGDFNFLINPLHEGIVSISIVKTEPFLFDERLFRK
jgi:RES domain-containing protein